MGRYANTTIRLDFPDLSEDDDPIFVTIRNPKTVPSRRLLTADLPAGSTTEQYVAESMRIIAGLVVDWHVYDGNSDEDAPALPLPATVEAVSSLPHEITDRISDEVARVVNPPR